MRQVFISSDDLDCDALGCHWNAVRASNLLQDKRQEFRFKVDQDGRKAEAHLLIDPAQSERYFAKLLLIIMHLSQDNMLKFIRRHAHDVRNHCSGIDLDAMLLVELSDDPELSAMALRLKKQVARIELDLKLLLLKMEEPRAVTLTVGDLLQLWRMKITPLSNGIGSIVFPEKDGETPIALDSKLTLQALCDLTLRTWDRHPGAALEVTTRITPQLVMLDLIHPAQGLAPKTDLMEEMAAVLAVSGLRLHCALDPTGERWVVTLAIPLNGAVSSTPQG